MAHRHASSGTNRLGCQRFTEDIYYPLFLSNILRPIKSFNQLQATTVYRHTHYSLVVNKIVRL